MNRLLIVALCSMLGCDKASAPAPTAPSAASTKTSPPAPTTAAPVNAAPTPPTAVPGTTVPAVTPGAVAPAPSAVAPPATKMAELPNLSVADVATMLQKNLGVTVDANSAGTRKNKGTVPGAILLTDYETYNVTELGTDKARQLVFYCGSEQCTASHDAAKRALAAGFSNVKIMSAGIAGWIDAGQPVAKL